MFCYIAVSQHYSHSVITLEKEDYFLTKFSELIKKLRKSKKFKMEDFSFMSEIDYTTLYRTEHKQNIYIYTAYKILKNLNIDILKIMENELKKTAKN